MSPQSFLSLINTKKHRNARKCCILFSQCALSLRQLNSFNSKYIFYAEFGTLEVCEWRGSTLISHRWIGLTCYKSQMKHLKDARRATVNVCFALGFVICVFTSKKGWAKPEQSYQTYTVAPVTTNMVRGHHIPWMIQPVLEITPLFTYSLLSK